MAPQTPPPWFHYSPLDGDSVVVTGDEAHHIRTARRLKAGDAIVLFDGAGTVAPCTIVRVARHAVEVAIESRIVRERPADRLTLAVAMPKGKRQDLLIEKATELSVSALWPMVTRRSVVRPEPSRVGKWQRTAIEAAKQSHQPLLPTIQPPAPIDQVLAQAKAFGVVLLASLSDDAIPAGRVFSEMRPPRDVLALVGPEGGFTDEEHRAAIDAGAVGVRLAAGVLRIETAALALAVLAGAHADDPPKPGPV